VKFTQNPLLTNDEYSFFGWISKDDCAIFLSAVISSKKQNFYELWSRRFNYDFCFWIDKTLLTQSFIFKVNDLKIISKQKKDLMAKTSLVTFWHKS
jgi:hypothetical protein